MATLSLWSRARHEAAPSSVEIALEWNDAARLSSAERVPLQKWLSAMKSQGARGVTLDVQSVRELDRDGRLSLLGRAEAMSLFPRLKKLPAPYRYVVSCRDAALLARVETAFRAQKLALPLVQIAPDAFAVALSNAAISSWPIGLDARALEQIRAAKMEPIARLDDWNSVNPAQLNGLFGQLRQDGARIVVMGSAATTTSAPGDKTLLPVTAWALRKHGLSLAWIEADTTRGTPELARQSEGFIVRAHRVSAVDSLSLQPEALAERYARAARERNVRLLLVRLPRGLAGESDENAAALPPQWKRSAFEQQLGFVASLSGQTRENRWARAGRPTLTIGLAKRWGIGARSPRRAMLARAGAGVGIVGASLLVLSLFVALSPRASRWFTLGGLILVTVLAPFAGAGAKILALWAALIFPVLALAWSGVWSASPRTRRAAVWCALAVLARATALSLAGGAIIAALLNDWTFQVKVADFAGTKAASIAPILAALLVLIGEFWPGTQPARGWIRLRRRLRVFGRRAFPLRDVFLGLAAFLVVGLWLARSGNDSGVAVSTWEWKARALLETLFVARPRTKEFLLCHPALILGALALMARRRAWAWPLLTLGIIGQINVVNSFAQANNPLYVPFWRTVLSLLLGSVFGGFLAWHWAPKLSFARDQTRWHGWPRLARVATATGALAITAWIAHNQLLRRRYDELTAPSQNTTWPWKNARTEALRRGVTHWQSALADGTTLDLLKFDFRANPRLRFGLWDSDLAASSDKSKPLNRFAYWRNGIASQAAQMNADGDLIACWNAGFFGLLNAKPREVDRAFHLSPVVRNGRAFYDGANHRWTWGAQIENGIPKFKLEHEPKFANLSADFDAATGTLQALMRDGQPLELRPYLWFGELPQKPPVASTPREAGHIPTLDWMHTSRLSAGWNDAGQLWVLIVKEPDGEASSRALVNRRERGRGGWTLADSQRFWLSMRAQGVTGAVGLDGGDVAQAAWRNSEGDFTVLAPRIATPATQNATQRLRADAQFQAPAVRALRGGALSYFVVREKILPPKNR